MVKQEINSVFKLEDAREKYSDIVIFFFLEDLNIKAYAIFSQIIRA